MGVDLDEAVADLAVVERYVREPGREPGDATVGAFQRLALLIPDMVAELRDHRANCVRLIDGEQPGVGWFVRCPGWAPDNPECRCGTDWPSHDMLTAARISKHLHDYHGWNTTEAADAIGSLEASGQLPKASNV